MVIARILGGIGNQLFQYAAARRLAVARGTHVLLDCAWFRENANGGATPRPYLLSGLRIAARRARISQEKYYRLLRSSRLRSLLGPLANALPRYVREPHFHFWPDLLGAPGRAYLDGYWQSPKYFQDITHLIRAEAVPLHPLSQAAADLRRLIRSEASVGVQVRRTDFVGNSLHDCIGPAYFRQGVRALSKRVSKPRVFVFSDDIPWCEANLALGAATHFVRDDVAGTDPCVHLHLLSGCQHFVISNSTFGWWGAWLSTRPGKVVIAPRRWFRDPSYDTGDLIPSHWRRE